MITKTISLFFYFSFCFIFINRIIGGYIVQDVQAESPVESTSYRLDAKTVERGYPIESTDALFRLLVLPGIFTAPVEVVVAPFNDSQAVSAYTFQITQTEVVPLIKRPLTVVFESKGVEARYKRLYYYHAPGSVWLALTTRVDAARDIVLSTKVDFAEATIGFFAGDTPLPDRIERVVSDESAEEEPESSLSSPSIENSLFQS